MGLRLGSGRNHAGRAAALGGIVLAGLLAAGCAHQTARPRRASVRSCARASISAIRHRAALTSLPAACRGLTAAQLNMAADAAVNATSGTMHGKTLARARRRELSPLLPHLGSAVAAPPGQPLTASAASRPGGAPLGLAALVTWLVTVGLGCLMLATWITRDGLRDLATGGARRPPVMNLAHLGLAVAGLITWISYLVTGWGGLAWIACVLLLPVAGLGMSLLFLRLPGRPAVAEPVPVAAALRATPAQVPGSASPSRQPPWRSSPLVVAAHVTFATATMMLALLAAIGSG